MEKMKRKVANLLTTSNNSNGNNKEREQARARVITGDGTLQPIQNAVNNEIDEKNDRNTSDHGAHDSKSNSGQLKCISFLLLIREVTLNDLGDERRYCR